MSSDFSKSFPLHKSRTHEVCGPGAQTFAFALAGHLDCAVLWICESWQTEQINPTGFSTYIDPQKLLMAKAKDQTDVLAVAEEGLRSGAVPLIVMVLSKPLSLTAGRRLQLAAKTGGATGLCVIPDGMGKNAAQTRWQCSPIFDPGDSTLQRWALIKNKSGTLAVWDVKWDAETHRVIVVSKAAQRPGSTRTPP